MEMNPSQQEYYDSLEKPWKKALYKSDLSPKDSTDVKIFMLEAWSLVETFKEALEVADSDYNNETYFIEWKEFLDKALALVKTRENADTLMYRTDAFTEDEFKVLDKFLELCEYKEEVEEMMARICEYCEYGGLEFEEYFIRIFKRGHELPFRPESEESDE